MRCANSVTYYREADQAMVDLLTKGGFPCNLLKSETDSVNKLLLTNVDMLTKQRANNSIVQ